MAHMQGAEAEPGHDWGLAGAFLAADPRHPGQAVSDDGQCSVRQAITGHGNRHANHLWELELRHAWGAGGLVP